VITKHAGTGGRVSVASVKEQLLYEMGDPHEYITPDCVADFTSIHLEQAGPDRVRFTGIRGRPATPFYKGLRELFAGFKAVGTPRLRLALTRTRKRKRSIKSCVSDSIASACASTKSTLPSSVRTAATGIAAAEPSPEIESHLPEGDPARRRAIGKSRGCRAIHEGDRAARAQRSAGRDRTRQRPPKVEEIVAYWPALLPKTK
jgi:hypothetical protein